MRHCSRARAVVGLTALSLITVVPLLDQPADAGPPAAQSQVVSAVPASYTPWIQDGASHAITQVGSTLVVGGVFTTVSAPGGTASVTRSNIVAFDATTGALSSFAPTLDGGVEALTPGPDGHSVFVGGQFKNVNGLPTKGLALLDLSTGTATPGFKVPALDGVVNHLATRGSRLFLGGTFTRVAGLTHGGLATVSSTTGALDSYVSFNVSGHHNYTGLTGQAFGAVGITSFDISPDGTQLVAIGNFTQVDGVLHDQIVRVGLGDASLTVLPWNTSVYGTACSSNRFDSWIRDVGFSPDGSYFVVTATGGPHPGEYCDSAARFESASLGTNVPVTWVNWTGGDSLWSVAVTGSAVYVGGHARWMNNPTGIDSAGPGAVPRPGIAALDPANGLPLSWNPGRNPRGQGAWALLATPAGLWVGSDTDYVGNFRYHRGRIAFFPVSGGATVAPGLGGSLPNDVFKVGSFVGGVNTDQVTSITLSGSTASSPNTLPADGTTWGSSRAATQIDGKVLYGWSDGTLRVRSFDGANWGAVSSVDPYNDAVWSTVKTGSGTGIYRGVQPSFYPKIPTLSSMFYSNGRLYYTQSGSSKLSYRTFSADSYILGVDEFDASQGLNWSDVAGAFVTGNTLYWASASSGSLHSTSFTGGNPVVGTDVVVSGPAKDGFDWRARGLIVSPRPPHGPNQQPTARIVASCVHATCSLDASTSSDPENGPLTYAWDFGDGSTSSAATVSHSYVGQGAYTVSLIVTDDLQLASPVASQSLLAGTAAPVSFTGASHFSGVASAGAVTVPSGGTLGDALLLFVSVNTGASTITPPAGWSLIGSQNTASGALVTQAYSKVTKSADAGSMVTVSLSAIAQLNVELLAYHNTDPNTPVQAFASRADTTAATLHVAPAITVAGAGAVPVSYWVDKSSTTTAWNPPSALTVRDSSFGTGSGHLTALLADPASAVPAGPYIGLTAATNAASAKANMWTVVLNPLP